MDYGASLLLSALCIVVIHGRSSGTPSMDLNNINNGARRRLKDIILPQRVAAADTNNITSPRLKQYLSYRDGTKAGDELRYNVTAFGKDYLLILKPHRAFLAPNLAVQHVYNNVSLVIPHGANLAHCYYNGYVHGDPVSTAFFDLCYGLRGAFKTSGGIYLIEPLVPEPARRSAQDELWQAKHHQVTNHGATLPADGSSHCALDAQPVKTTTVDRSSSTSSEFRSSRTKRSPAFYSLPNSPRYVELMVTADKSVLDYYGSEFEVKKFIQNVIGIVHNIFRNPSIGNAIDIVLTGIKILKNDVEIKPTNHAKKLLSRFCKWQYEQNAKSDDDPGHYDTAVLITRTNLCRSYNSDCQILGLAALGTMCDPRRSCSIAEDNGLGVAFTIAHEIGHTFNIGHDVKETKKCLNEIAGLHVMSRFMNNRTALWTWSSCSRESVTEALEKNHFPCLLDEPQYRYKEIGKLPGEVYTPDMQCKLTYGKKATVYKATTCRNLWCIEKYDGYSIIPGTQDIPLADGSTCGRVKWCIRGRCVRRRRIRTVNGGWSEWSAYGPCSRTCGGGVAFSTRRCNNPRPSTGGKFCVGVKKRFRSCQTQNCPKGVPTFREVQCSAQNGKRHPKTAKWIPDSQARFPCELFCTNLERTEYTSGIVKDGTKCDEKTFDICVEGICRPAGCDNELDSKTRLDECGVCGGDNSTCERFTKTWYKNVTFGYTNPVAILYPGYSSIRVSLLTPGYNKRADDDNYIVLHGKNPVDILNTGSIIKSPTKITYTVGDLQITYSGSLVYPEYVLIDGKLEQTLHLGIFAVGRLVRPKMTYSYLAPVHNTYSWDNKGAWGECSHDCQGWRRRKLMCKRQDNAIVSDKFCDQQMIPEAIKEMCNTDCLFKWMVAGRGPCKPDCGQGIQTIFYRCVQHYIESGANFARSSRECKRTRQPYSEQPCNGTCVNFAWIYSEWSTCSKTCGKGSQTRQATCIEKIDGRQRKRLSSVCYQIRKRHLQRSCNTNQCPRWQTGEWFRCSAACGEGIQRRKVSCVSQGEEIEESLCDLTKKPEHQKACMAKPCPHWEYDEWSDCLSEITDSSTVSCGTGEKMRLVYCVDSDKNKLEERDCRAIEKPVSRKKCKLQPCDKIKTVFFISKVEVYINVRWIVGDWGECSSTCGSGRQQRSVSCVDKENVVIEKERCKNISKPLMMRTCLRYCGVWRFSDWTPCSSSCGVGTQRRQVKCYNRHNYNHHLTEDAMCDPVNRPPQIQQCANSCSPDRNPSPTTNGRWKTGVWSQCSKSCDDGMKKRVVMCLDEQNKQDYYERTCEKTRKPESTIRCNLGKCPQWKYKQWSSCSKTCGLGVVKRKVYCTDEERVLDDRDCNVRFKPAAEKSCYDRICPVPVRWIKEEWQPCSVKCGRGTKRRRVWCENYNGERVSTIHCRRLKRIPKSVKECRRNTCGVWETGLWGTCSARCDDGEQVRSVRCRRSHTFVANEYCHRADKPEDSRRCRRASCRSVNKYRWFTTEWKQCSESCGTGFKTRMVACSDHHGVRVALSYCNQQSKPVVRTICKAKDCLPKWNVGDWSSCSKSCDLGIQTREVTCPYRNHDSVDLCNRFRKPPSRRECNLGSCDGKYTWRTGPWSKCPVTCGEGTMRRAVKCVAYTDRITTDSKCLEANSIKPDDNKKCSLPPCLPRSCKDIQKQNGKQEDNEFILTINEKRIKVYCFGMLTDNPKEYITLPSGPKRNFAEYYHRSLKNPNECPYNGDRRDDCPACHKEIFSSSGGTYFSKVRLDISRMALIGNDYTFATTRGRNSISFGTAGDCYSKTQCPQGRFNIDLRGSGLSLKNKVSWISYGHSLSRIIDIQRDRQVVSGMCGGYCGICRPHRSLRVVINSF